MNLIMLFKNNNNYVKQQVGKIEKYIKTKGTKCY